MDNIAAYAIHILDPCKDFLCSVKLPNRKESLRNCKDDYIDEDTDKDSHGDDGFNSENEDQDPPGAFISVKGL